MTRRLGLQSKLRHGRRLKRQNNGSCALMSPWVRRSKSSKPRSRAKSLRGVACTHKDLFRRFLWTRSIQADILPFNGMSSRRLAASTSDERGLGELLRLMTPAPPLTALTTPTILLVPNPILAPTRGLPACLPPGSEERRLDRQAGNEASRGSEFLTFPELRRK